MDVRTRRIAPVVGGVTAAATAVGAFVPATQVAVAAPDHAAGATSPLGVAQEGVFESCSAYFGFGKDEGVGGIVAFEVTDVEGDDTTAHAVPDDVDVVLVLSNPEGDTVECVPEEVTEADWDEWLEHTEFANAPEWPPPGPIRFAYPSVEAGFDIEGLGELTSVGFRVVGVPTGHTLVSPTGVQALPALFAGTGETPWEVHPGIPPLLTELVSAEAATAYTTAMAACRDEVEHDASDPVLVEAVQAILDFVGIEETVEVADCLSLDISAYGAFALGTLQGYEQVLPIQLAAPAQEPPTTPTSAAPTPPPTGAQPVTAAPTYTG